MDVLLLELSPDRLAIARGVEMRPDMGIELGATSVPAPLGKDAGGELVSEPGTLMDLSADKGLVPNGPSPWNVDKLP